MAEGAHARAKEHSPCQKRQWSLFAQCGLLRFVAKLSLFPPRLFAERKQDGTGKV
jgi:hypothetical protein